MIDHSGGIIDWAFFLTAFVVLAFVALKPDSFIRGITLGRASSSNVACTVMRVTQVIAGLGALSIAIFIIVSFLGSSGERP
jgi:hypothetical protein